MRHTHLRHVDLNLLLALHALLEERHVTRAAKRCFLSQPAMSRALERLRETFGDQLLIRSGRAYERTVRGDSLLRELQSLLPRLESMVRGQDFDPQRSQERFRLAVRDHASITLIPPLIRRIRSAAPDIRFGSVPVAGSSLRSCDRGEAGRSLQRGASAPPPCRVRFFSKSILPAW
jgi:DNA-binding transcriptional LysR family regulator